MAVPAHTTSVQEEDSSQATNKEQVQQSQMKAFNQDGRGSPPPWLPHVGGVKGRAKKKQKWKAKERNGLDWHQEGCS